MTRILSLTLLLSTACALQASSPIPMEKAQNKSGSETGSSVSSAASTEVAALNAAHTNTPTGDRTPAEEPQRRRQRSAHTRFDASQAGADTLELAAAGAAGAAQELFGAEGVQNLHATLTALQAAKEDPNLMTVLTAASLTTEQLNAWAPLVTTVEGREKIKQGCMKGLFGACAKKQAAAAAQPQSQTAASEQPQLAATRTLHADSDMVTVRMTRRQLNQMNALTTALQTHAPQPVVLTAEQALVARSALAAAQTRMHRSSNA